MDSLRWCSGNKRDGIDGHFTKPTNFPKNHKGKDGLDNRCKACKVVSNRRYNTSIAKKRANDISNNSGKDYADDILGFYVYFHRDLDGTVVYIGKGKLDRAYSISGRSEAHANWVVDKMSIGFNWVELQDKCMSEEEALNLEAALISEYNPRFNVIGKARQ